MANSPPSKGLIQSLCRGSKHSSAGFRQKEVSRLGPCKKKAEEEMSYTDLNLDTHPAVARLQNEQNLRLEGMEQRISKIRKSAQQEAERRKFAHLFRARTEDKSQTELLLKEASAALQVIKNKKLLKKSLEKKECVTNSNDLQSSSVSKQVVPDWTCQPESDKGDIIPVHIISDKATVSEEITKEEQCDSKVREPLMWLLQPVETFQLNGVVLWLVLPFLLPVLLLVHLIRHLSPHSDSHNRKKN